MTERDLFLKALEIPDPADRAAFLDGECAGNPDLRRGVEALLAAAMAAGNFLDHPHPAAGRADAVRTGAYHSRAEQIGTIVAGKYKLLQAIGEGGMGSVFMADQTEPVKRRVAVKLIRGDMDSKSVLARFEAERQALALMDHPHIAKVLDAGTTESNSPFFVMELVKGVPINEFCDGHKLSVGERLTIFMQVCSAVQHAHQKGIIHRDLKPTNILVESHDGRPVPKVIDFGLAKAMSGQPLTEHTLFTQLGAVAGTPLYMAPEQAAFNAIDVDTRADIYALGVILYELLTGTTPIERTTLKKAAFDEILRVVREQEPPNPSTRLSRSDSKASVAAVRRMEPAKLGRFVKGELDWIVMKALSKERDRRYETANGFAKDVERFLNNEPVVAGPPSARYKLRKFVRRNRPQVIAASLVLLALVTGIAGTVWQARIAQHERDLAQTERDRAFSAREAEVEQRKKAEKAEADTLADFRAGTDDAIEQLIGSKAELGPQEKAYLENTLKRWQAFANREGDDERSQAIRGEGHYRVGALWAKLGRKKEPRAEFQEARDIWKKLIERFPAVPAYQRNLALSHNDLGLMLFDLGKREEARAEFQAAGIVRKKLVEQFPAVSAYQHDLANTYHNLGYLLFDLGEREEARTEYLAARAIEKKLVEKFPTVTIHQRDLAKTHNNLGILLASLGKTEEARAEFQLALVLRKKLVEQFPDMPAYQQELAASFNDLGPMLARLGKGEEARAQYQVARDLQKKLVEQFPAMPAYQQALARTNNNLGIQLKYLGRGEEASVEYRAARDVLRKLAEEFPAVPAYQQELAITDNNLAILLASLGKMEEARAEYQAARDIFKKLVEEFPAVPGYRIPLGNSYCSYGELIRTEGNLAGSLEWFDLAIRTLRSVHEQEPREVDAKSCLCRSHANRAHAYDLLQNFAEALKDWERAIELSPPADQPQYRARRAVSLIQAGQVAEAVAEAADLTKSSNWTADQRYDFACVYAVASGKIADKKQEYADRAVELLQRAVKAGFKEAAHMKKDTDLDALRERPDFKKLLAELEAKAAAQWSKP